VANWWASLRRRRDPAPRQIIAVTLALSLALLAFGVIRMGTADLQQNEIAQSLEDGGDSAIGIDEILGTASTAPTTQTTIAQPGDSVVDPLASTTTTSSTTSTTTTTLPKEPIKILAIGDSVMKGAANLLTQRGYVVIAEEGLQMDRAVPVLESLKADGLLDETDAVVVHLGTNGPIEADTLNALLDPLSSISNVLLYTIHADRSWTVANNEIIRNRDGPNDNIVLIDWDVRANECTDSCLYGDGIHLQPNGQEFYADLAQDWTGI
jgi:hypothetical protein